MALAKKKYIDASKRRLKEKLTSIREQADELVSYVNEIVAKAEESCDELLNVSNKTQFLEKFIPVMTKLEEYHQFLLNASLPDEDNDALPGLDSDDEDNEDEGDGDGDGGGKMRNESKSSAVEETNRTGKKTVNKDASSTKQNQKADEKTRSRNANAEERANDSVKDVDQNPQGFENLDANSTVTSQTSGAGASEAAGARHPAGVQQNAPNLLTHPLLQLLMNNPNSGLPGFGYDVMTAFAQAAGNTTNPQSAQGASQQTQVPYAESGSAPGDEHVFKLPLTRENVAKISVPGKGAAGVEDITSSSAGRGGSVVHSEGDGPKADGGDESIAGTGSSGLHSERKKGRHPTRRKLVPRQKLEKSSSEKSSQVTSDRASSKAQTTGAQGAFGPDEPGHGDLPLVADYGNGPFISTLILTEGKLTEAYVIDVTSPWLFWMQPASHKLKRLMAELNQYEDLLKPGSVSTKPPLHLKAGMVVCAQYSHDLHWYRALVVSVQRVGHEKHMEVLYLDYGNREFLPASQIRPLMPQFADLPCQAFPVALSEVAPADGSSEWSQNTTTFVANLAGTVVSTLIKKVHQCPVVLVEVYKQVNVSSSGLQKTDYFSFAQRLVENKLAVRASDDRIVQFYSMVEYQDSERKPDKTVLSRLGEFAVLVGAMPQVQPRKEEKVKMPVESGETLASKLKVQEKPEKFRSGTEVEMPVSRGNPPDDEVLEDDLDEDLDSMLDLELGKRTDGVLHKATTTSSKMVNLSGGKSGEKSSENASARAEDQANLHWAKWDRLSPENKVESPIVNVKSSAAGKGITEQHKSSSARDRKIEKPIPDKEKDQPEKSGRKSKPAAIEKSPAPAKEIAAAKKGTPDRKIEKDNPKATSTPKQKSDKDISAAGAMGTKKSGKASKSLRQKGRPSPKMKADGVSSPVASADQKSAKKTIEKIKSQEKDEAVKKLVQEPPLEKPEKTEKIEVTGRTEDASASAASNNKAVSDIGSDISRNSSIVKDDNSSTGSPPPSPDAKQLSWEDFLQSGIEGYPCLEVKAPKDGFVVCLMSHIVSPSHFYVHLAEEGCATAVDKLFKDVNDYFEEHNVVALQKFFEPALFDRCVARYQQDQLLYRAKIVQIGDGVAPTKFRVFFVDFGNQEWVDKDEIYPLPPKFTTIPPQAVCCMLPEVQPKEGSKPLDADSGGWSSEAIDQFKFLTGFTTPLQLHIMLFHDEIIRVHEEAPLGVKLANVEGDEDVWIAHELVNGGFADPTDFFGISNRPITEYHTSSEPVTLNEKNLEIDDEVETALQKWDPMNEDFTSIRNSYKVDITDPGVAIMGYKAQDEKRVCRYFDMDKPCPRGEFCPYLHVKTAGVMTTDKVEVFAVSDEEQCLVAPEVGSWVLVEVTAVYSPSHFYVSFPCGTKPVASFLCDDVSQDGVSQDEGYAESADEETLESLKESMNEHYRKIRFRDIDMTVLANGEIVAAKFKVDGNWYRARILDTDPDNYRVKVFYLDFGNCEWLDERDTRQMQKRFMHLPFQALECHMAIQPVSGREWSREVIDIFYDMVDGESLYAQVKECSGSSMLTVELMTGKEINLADLLVTQRYAKRPELKKTPKRGKKENVKLDLLPPPKSNYRPG